MIGEPLHGRPATGHRRWSHPATSLRARALRLGSLPLALLLTASLAGCPAALRAGSAQPAAVLQIECQVADAVVWVDDRVVGEIGMLADGIRLAPGRHRIEVRHDRFHTTYLELTLAEGRVTRVPVRLTEALD